MKEVFILIIVLMLVFIPNVLFKNYLYTSGNELIAIAEELKENVTHDKELNAQDALKLKEEFYDKEKIWILIVDHDMLDEIEYEVEDCVALYSEENKREFLSAANRLTDEVEDLAKREEISFANIL